MNRIQRMTAKAIAFLSVVVMAAIVPRSVEAASGTLAPAPYQTVLDSSGNPISGACIWTYTAGTTTPIATYQDKALTSLNTNPITTDSSGQFVAWLTLGQSYKFVYENIPCAVSPPTHGAILRTVDGIDAVPSSASALDATGMAGETLTAGLCAYMSAGDGGKSQGQWYKCDTANAYSSSTYWIGIVPTTITIGTTGTIRLGGQVTGLAGLTVGAKYYVGSNGAISTTAVANMRQIGQADSATTMIVTGDPPPDPSPVVFVDDFRISLTSGTCETVSDVTAATTIYLTPCTGNRITLMDASGSARIYTTAEISIAVPATTATGYDVWVYASSGTTPTLELLAWTNPTTRATAIVRTNGRWTKTGDSTRLLVASFETTTVSGQTEDSVTKRLVSNIYNRRPRDLSRLETNASWNYSNGTWRQANAAAANQVDVFVSIAEAKIDLTLNALSSNSDSQTSWGAAAFGEDSTATPLLTNVSGGTATGITGAAALVMRVPTVVRLGKHPAIGRHFYAWLESGSATGTTTFYGTGLGGAAAQGLNGWIEN